MNTRLNKPVAVNALALSIACASGWAENEVRDASTRPYAIEEVIVTAQKREESLQDTPIAISAFSAQSIENMGITQASDIGRFAPNLTSEKLPSSFGAVNFTIRGITETEPSMSVDPAVGIYMNGIYMARNNGLAFDVVDLERIEVLRGPQGSLYGRNSTGGAVNLVTAKPKGEFGFKQVITSGRRDKLRYHTTVDLPKAGDLSAKLSYLHNEQNGYVKNSTTNFLQGRAGDFGEIDADAYLVALNWEPSDSFSVDYSYDSSDSTGMPRGFQLTFAEAVPPSVFGPNFDQTLTFGPGANDLGIADQVLLGTYAAFGNAPAAQLCSLDPACVNFANTANPGFGGATPAQAQLGTYLGVYGQAAAVADPDRVSALNMPYAGEQELAIEGHSVTLVWDLAENLTLKSLSAYREMDIELRTDLSGGGHLDLTAMGGGVVTLFAAGSPNRKSQEQFSQELQLIGSGDRLQYVAGLYYFEEEAGESTQEQTPFFFGNFGSGRRYETDNSAWAVFGQVTYTLPVLEDKLDVTLGLRYTEDDRAISIDEVVADTPASGTFSEQFDNVSGHLTLDYSFTNEVNGYFRIGTGYKAGGFLSRTSIANQRPFDEETLTSYEFGLKSQWWDNRMQLNAALFYSEYDDKQVTQFVPTDTGAESTIQNAAQTTYQGFELELLVIPLAGLTLNLSYGYLDPEYESYTFFDPSGAVCGTQGSVCDVVDRGVFPTTPDETAALGMEYEFEPFAWGQLRARIDATYNSGYTHDTISSRVDDFIRADAHTLVDARATLSDIALGDKGLLRVALWGKNLTDEEYRSHAIGAFESIGFAGAVYNEPKSYGIDIIYEY